jgi:hypothetical protein
LAWFRRRAPINDLRRPDSLAGAEPTLIRVALVPAKEYAPTDVRAVAWLDAFHQSISSLSGLEAVSASFFLKSLSELNASKTKPGKCQP